MTTENMIQQVSILTDKEFAGLAKEANQGTQLHDIVSIESAFRPKAETHVEKFDRVVGLDQESAASWRKRWEVEQLDKFPSLLQSAEDQRREALNNNQ